MCHRVLRHYIVLFCSLIVLQSNQETKITPSILLVVFFFFFSNVLYVQYNHCMTRGGRLLGECVA